MRTLSRIKSNRESLIRNLVTSLILYESIETSLAKAKEVKIFCDHMIPRAKSADLIAIKYLNTILFDKNAVKKVMKELLPRFANRQSGFVRIYKTGNRLGDNAPTAIVELVDKKVFIETKIAKEKKEKPAKASKEANTVKTETKKVIK